MINQKIAKSLQTNVAKKVKEVMKEKIEDEVYDAYPNPIRYERLRDKQGGLLHDDSIIVTPIGDNAISIESHRMDGDRNVSEIIESGHGYQFQFEFNGVARPFTEETREHFRDTNEHIAELAKGLIAQGLKVTR